VDIHLIDRTAAEGQFADEAMEPISSKTAVSPSISIVERLIMMTVEKALPDCGRQRSQWQRPAAIGAAEILLRTTPHMHRPVRESGISGRSSVISPPVPLRLRAGAPRRASRALIRRRQGIVSTVSRRREVKNATESAIGVT
jgi:hypothetical protein